PRPAARDLASRRRARRALGLVVRVPERERDRRAVARPGHPGGAGSARGERGPASARLRGRLCLGSPRDSLGRRHRGAGGLRREEIWPLRDVSLAIEPGEAVGIVGRNGSGKTTLLRLIAGIFQPTGGRLEVGGEVGSLLGLGAGFHPDFTGRENVYMNGAIHGLKRRYIDERFDEIVAFAELEPFIDAPVRTYSSGMYMRLGFSVATHLDPDILLLDEVFAVG